jgi:hypothetical protein
MRRQEFSAGKLFFRAFELQGRDKVSAARSGGCARTPRPEGDGAMSPTDDAKWIQLDQPKGDGIVSYRLRSWSGYFDFLEAEVFEREKRRAYVWRGQRSSAWSLSTSLDRLLSQLGVLDRPNVTEIAQEHLEAFQYATRGRRGVNPPQLRENEWWALGQHFGLATPLLDWSRSPFAASYFAFEDPANSSDYRVVFGLDQRAVRAKGNEIANGPSLERGRIPIIEFVDPLTDENARLVNQSGLFTRAPIGKPIEQWIVDAFEGSNDPILVRIEIPTGDRVPFLRALNRMNINHLSLFPDLLGASRSTNLRLELER